MSGLFTCSSLTRQGNLKQMPHQIAFGFGTTSFYCSPLPNEALMLTPLACPSHMVCYSEFVYPQQFGMPFVLAHVNAGPEIPNTAGGMLSLCLLAVAGPCTGSGPRS